MFRFRLLVLASVSILFGLSFWGARPSVEVTAEQAVRPAMTATQQTSATPKAAPTSPLSSTKGEAETLALLTLLVLGGADPTEVAKAVAVGGEEAPIAP